MLKPGDTVDRYIVEGTLGAGGIAEVYAVRHAALGLDAALKVLRIRSPQLTSRLLREGRAQARLQHPHVVRVLDLLEVDGAPALLMERVFGPTLAEIIAQGPLPLERIEHLVRGVMLGLHAAHEIGLVHRDLKPSNVLVSDGDLPRIADFGLATALLDETDHALTHPGSAIGTPAYMAPEQHEDAHTVDARADVFALGVVMYELLTGQAPAAGANFLAAWQKMTNKRWTPLHEAIPGLPARIDSAVAWALEPSRDARAPSIAALWERWFEEPFPGTEIPSVFTSSLSQPSDTSRRSSSGSAIPRTIRPLFGRASELAHVAEILEPRGALVTLLGTAGVGKTRLAVAIAEQWGDERKSSIWVDLQSARDDNDLLRMIAWATDNTRIAETGSRQEASAAKLAQSLGHRGALLLVLDNFEQMPRAAANLLGQWASLCPSLRMLVTSRQPLGLDVEHLVEIAPLALPAETSDVLRSPAWELFRAAAPQGALDQVDLPQAIRLLRALDGLPLALELAAARLEVLDLRELERRLIDRFTLLSAPGSRPSDASVPERHGALFNAIAWSWSLLGPHEQRALGQLSAFVSPFPLEAAEAVVDVGEPALDILHSLLRRSLIRKQGARFSLLLSIREFAAKMLDPAEQQGVWRRHARWFAGRCALWQSPEHIERGAALEMMVEAADELGCVLDRATRQPDLVEDALNCALARSYTFELRGPVQGSLQTIELAMSLSSDSPIAAHRMLELRTRRAYAYRVTGRIRQAIDELLFVADNAPSPDLKAVALTRLGDTHPDQEQSRIMYSRALEIFDAHGLHKIALRTRIAMATTCAMLDRFDEADELIAVSRMQLSQEDIPLMIEFHKAQGLVALAKDDMAPARESYLLVRSLAQQIGHRRALSYASGQLGLIADISGDYDAALPLLQDAIDGYAQQGDPTLAAAYLAYHARALMNLGRDAEALAELSHVVTVQDIDSHLHDSYAMFGAIAAASAGPDAVSPWVAHFRNHMLHLAEFPVHLARGFAAAEAGERSAVAGHADAAEALVHDVHDLPTRALMHRRIQALRATASAWRVAEDGSWVESPEGTRIDLRRHVANARIVAFLADRRVRAPGEPTDAEGLAEIGWPGERIVATAAANRVRVALSTLRRLGLSDLIERVGGGWQLAEGLQVQIVSG